jgi:hypothetical protein
MLQNVTSKVLTAVTITVFWYVTPCSLVKYVQTFRKNLLPPYSGYRSWVNVLQGRIDDGDSTSLRNVSTILLEVMYIM